ncbi:hypothetical protein NBRC10512_002445 [Rhodotorula toruloides]|uniref:RHTO0S20e02586g1_1 n=2 Tax=Rhodotorula toruloides TaxID=5286 RepID=A0A061BLK1_RHOTO|nr:protein of unknown function DUF2343 [Rhodotorula toruloides NP11]EMS19586.1 protein of unknown function DUF2343 [Rhodotorula toruloides NP11]CDR48843.1 RHTO0S20e02586g1_1 [Rhodotorula toruloides]
MRPSNPSLLKLLALPLSQPKSTTHPPPFLLHAVRQSLQTASADAKRQDQPAVTRYTHKAIDKAADLWAGLGKADEGTWKRRAYVLGERMMDRIEYEEWALKAIDPALAPKLVSSKDSAHVKETVDVLFPPSLLDDKALLSSLKASLEHREPHHRSAMWRCLLLAPVTLPFAIVPVVPNFPLFYVLWRAWSHFRAWKASQYLSSLIGSPSLRLLPSSDLDSIYSPTPSSSPPRLLLTPDRVPKLVERFKMDEEERKELERAVGQSEKRLGQVSEVEESEAMAGTKEVEKKD